MTVGHIGAWTRAAAERDCLLMEIMSVVQRERCDAVVVYPPSDTIGGVYVFRNGFAEALCERGAAARVGTINHTPERCRVGRSGQLRVLARRGAALRLGGRPALRRPTQANRRRRARNAAVTTPIASSMAVEGSGILNCCGRRIAVT
jgi:hypothetical protein